jgi:ribonuclease HII
MPDFAFEAASGCDLVCGIDEVGRGPWAGPVVAAAVILDRARLPASLAAAIDDSKVLTRAQREAIFAELPGCACTGVGSANVEEIERLNIYWATMLAMQRAVAALRAPPDLALVDGKGAPALSCKVRCIVGGDALSLSIAAASIVAKVTRDRLMSALAKDFPDYGFERHVGYGTSEHRAALVRLGPTPHHRMSFPSVREILSQLSITFPSPRTRDSSLRSTPGCRGFHSRR